MTSREAGLIIQVQLFFGGDRTTKIWEDKNVKIRCDFGQL